MSILKDFLKRKDIDKEAQLIIEKCADRKSIRALSNMKQEKIEKSASSLTRKIKNEMKKYTRENKLGFYGKARLIKAIQNDLYKTELDNEIVGHIVEKIIYI